MEKWKRSKRSNDRGKEGHVRESSNNVDVAESWMYRRSIQWWWRFPRRKKILEFIFATTEDLQTSEDPIIRGLSHYDRENEVKEFLDNKGTVKQLANSGLVKIPRMFVHPPSSVPCSTALQVPVIDLKCHQSDRRREIVNEICKASETWGMFQVINQGIPISLMHKMLESVQKFHEQEEVKLDSCTTQNKKTVVHYSTGTYNRAKPANWRDTLVCRFTDGVVDPGDLPIICRDAMGEDILSGLLSEALGLSSDHLTNIKCFETPRLVCHYYPPCPEPQLTLGVPEHSDPYFQTVLLQDNIGGLQVLHKNYWVSVTPLEGALTINIGDLMQLITNDRFKSAVHRVKAQGVGPRVSAAIFLHPVPKNQPRYYGPLNELLSPNDKPLYKETQQEEYLACHLARKEETCVPALFVHPSDGIPTASSAFLGGIELQVPVIDLKGYQSDQRAEIVDAISKAAEKWGIFYLVNHGIPSSVIEKLLDSVKKFNEQPKEAKIEFYSHEFKNKVYYYTLEPLLGLSPAGWKDKLVCEFEDGHVDHVAIPELCR
ncbi:Non-hem dioxygenase N-terminal domain [Dillenia turbinata]|uniref:Non-hem dioxygenase N-terminal domain n=1 Tax=Dillenia turbinata TaxID=194707 RepID=A0AAN8VV85_9MAGN